MSDDYIGADRDQLYEIIRDLKVEIERLTLLASFARHDEGCNAPYGYSCRCGYEQAKNQGA